MEKFEYTQCSLNLANADAIVYRFANGEVSEITAADFDGDEKLFRKWKRLSDKYYIDERVKVGTCLYRVLYWHALCAIYSLEFFQNGIVVAFFVIELVDEENGRFRQFFCVSEVILSTDFGTEASVYEHHHRVGNIHCCEGCADEVVRTGTVYDIQFLALPLNVEDGGENRVSVFLLNREIVRNGVLLSYATAALNLSAFKQEGFCKGSLTRAVITKQRNVLDFF